MVKNILFHEFSEPFDGMLKARFEIHAGDGNLYIDGLTAGEQRMAAGKLEYFESQGLPIINREVQNDLVILGLRGGAANRPWFHLPWSSCNGATLWQIHLNQDVSSEITAHSDGGNLTLDLAGMNVTGIEADTGGGNLEVALPDHAIDLGAVFKTGAGNITIKTGNGTAGNNIIQAESGAGNVTVILPSHLAARIHATTGLGKVMVDSKFGPIEKSLYQSADFDSASDRVELWLKSGAGSVSIECPLTVNSPLI